MLKLKKSNLWIFVALLWLIPGLCGREVSAAAPTTTEAEEMAVEFEAYGAAVLFLEDENGEFPDILEPGQTYEVLIDYNYKVAPDDDSLANLAMQVRFPQTLPAGDYNVISAALFEGDINGSFSSKPITTETDLQIEYVKGSISRRAALNEYEYDISASALLESAEGMPLFDEKFRDADYMLDSAEYRACRGFITFKIRTKKVDLVGSGLPIANFDYWSGQKMLHQPITKAPETDYGIAEPIVASGGVEVAENETVAVSSILGLDVNAEPSYARTGIIGIFVVLGVLLFGAGIGCALYFALIWLKQRAWPEWHLSFNLRDRLDTFLERWRMPDPWASYSNLK